MGIICRYFARSLVTALLVFWNVLGGAGSVSAQELSDFRTLDDYFLQVSKYDRSFGGMFLRNDVLVINFANDRKELSSADMNSLLAAIQEAFGMPLDAHAPRFEFQPVTYRMADLLDWHRRVVDVLAQPGVEYTDVGEVANRVAIGVSAEADIELLSEFVARADVPIEAVVFQKTEPIVMFATVRDRIRPLEGGLQIKFGPFRCTAGIVVTLSDGSQGMITNSHCTNVQGGVEDTVYKQPNNGFLGSNRIGVEIADPAYTITGGLCTAGRFCRLSDSSLMQLEGGVSATRGDIARIGSWGSRTISSADPDYEISRWALFTLAGDVLTKVGRTTGKTAGTVTQTCFTADVSGTNFSQICQYRVASTAGIGGGVSPFSGAGDSGSPVFKLLAAPNPDHEVMLHGLLWGGNSAGTVFSPIFSILFELQEEVGSFSVTK